MPGGLTSKVIGMPAVKIPALAAKIGGSALIGCGARVAIVRKIAPVITRIDEAPSDQVAQHEAKEVAHQFIHRNYWCMAISFVFQPRVQALCMVEELS